MNNPKGIDAPIQDMQNLFIDRLWTSVATGKKSFNHRVFKNMRNGIVIPELFVSGKEYKEVSFDDRLTVLSWFDVSSRTSSYELGAITQDVGIFFMVNLAELYPTITHRAVEESHLDVQKILLRRPQGFKIESIITGHDAYGDYPLDKLKFPDMQPWHAFKFVCSVNYLLTC